MSALVAGAVGTAVANAAINTFHAVEVERIQREFRRRFEKQAQRIDLLRNIVSRLTSAGINIATITDLRPGTPEFEKALQDAVKNDMFYYGDCYADIYQPPEYEDEEALKNKRTIIGKFTGEGFVDSVFFPRDTGPIWREGCRNAEDQYRLASIQKVKEQRRFEISKVLKMDLGNLDLLLRAGLFSGLAIILILTYKYQKAIIAAQST